MTSKLQRFRRAVSFSRPIKRVDASPVPYDNAPGSARSPDPPPRPPPP